MIPHLLEANWEARVEEPGSPDPRVSARLHQLGINLDQALVLAAPFLPPDLPQVAGGHFQLHDLDLRFPVVNASVEGGDIVYHEYYDIGVAVSTDRGLIVPVLRDADRMDFAAIEKAVGGFAERARSGSITIEELTGGTFSITNGGVFGSLMSTPIVNAPQSAILGMHKIQERPVVVDGAVVVRPMMYLALTYDHRIIDGREAVQFLVAVKELLEDPSRLLLQV
jgi:2-oxoglutarate dehydrogenase E2 component (dihydrolipoamide succinyltransferase)